MAPTQHLPTHLNTLTKRSHESMTWYILGGTAGAFALVGVLGILAIWYRNRKHKHIAQIHKKKQRASMQQAQAKGKYVQLHDGKHSFEEEMRPTPTPPSSSSRAASQDRIVSKPTYSDAKDSRGRSGDLTAPADTRGRSRSASPNCPVHGTHAQHQHHHHAGLHLPHMPHLPPISLSKHDYEREGGRDSLYDPPTSRGRSLSPAPPIMSRNSSMLQGGSASRGPSPVRMELR